jgi:hypothetical protein
MTKFFETIAQWAAGFFAIVEEGCKFCFGANEEDFTHDLAGIWMARLAGGSDQAADAVGFFRSRGGRANRDIGSMSLLDGEVGELRAMLMDNFFETRKSLNFFKQMCVTAREFQKLNVKPVVASTKTSRDENRIRARHGATVGGVTDWWKGLKGAVGCHETEDALLQALCD